MSGQSPRDFGEWMLKMERQSKNALRNSARARQDARDVAHEVVEAALPGTPTAPVEITANGSIYKDASGAWRGRIDVDFPDVVFSTDGKPVTVTGYEMYGYEEDLFKGSTPVWEQYGGSDTSSITRMDLPQGVWYVMKVRAVGGEWSSTFRVRTAHDTTPPPQPTKPTAGVFLGAITVKWDGKAVTGEMPADFEAVVLCVDTEPSPGLDKAVTRLDLHEKIFVITGASYYAPVYIRLIAVDTSGNLSPWSEQVVAMTKPLVDADVILGEIDAGKTRIINAGKIVMEAGTELSQKLQETDTAISNTKKALEGPGGLTERLAGAETKLADVGALTYAAGQTLRQKLTIADTAISTAQGQINTLKDTTVPKLNTDLTAATGRLTAAEGKITTAQSDLSTAKTDITAAKKSITDNKAVMDSAVLRLGTAETEITGAKTRLGTAEGKLTTLSNTTLPGLTTELNTAKGRIDSAQAAINLIPGDIASAKTAAIAAAVAEAEAKDRAALATAAADAQTKAAAAQKAATEAAAADATKKTADAAAAAATDAQTKATKALNDAKADATSKANAAQAAAITAAAADAKSQSEAAEARAATTAAAAAKVLADKAQADALAAAKTYADAQADGAGGLALEAAKADATAKANAAKQAAIDAAALDATAKKEEAERVAAADAKTKADKALADAKVDATAKAAAAQTAATTAAAADAAQKTATALATAATDAQTKATKALNDAKADATSKANTARDAAVTAALAAAPRGLNFIVNGSFEQGFNGWENTVASNNGLDATVFRTGTQSWYSTGNGELRQAGIPVEAGQVWEFSCFYKTTADWDNKAPGGLRLQTRTADGLWVDSTAKTACVQNPEWTKSTCTLVIPAGVVQIRARIAFAYGLGARVWIDDIGLYDVTAAVLAAQATSSAREEALAAARAASGLAGTMGRTWFQPEPPALGTVYSWEGAADTSASIHSVDGQIVRKNLFNNAGMRGTADLTGWAGTNNASVISWSVGNWFGGSRARVMTWNTVGNANSGDMAVVVKRIITLLGDDAPFTVAFKIRVSREGMKVTAPGIYSTGTNVVKTIAASPAVTNPVPGVTYTVWATVSGTAAAASDARVRVGLSALQVGDALEMADVIAYAGAYDPAQNEWFWGDTEDERAGDLWIDTDEGNTPKRWDSATNTWTAVTDQKAIDAAIAAAAADATAKADKALADAKADATAKANAAQAAAITAADVAAKASAKAAAETVEARVALAAAADATKKAADAQTAALAAAKTYADAQADGAGGAALEAAKLDATTKANAAKQAAIEAAALDATAKQEEAEANAAVDAEAKANAALAAAKVDAKNKADAALADAKTDAASKAEAARKAAVETAAADAQTKANNAKQAAIDAAAITAQSKVDTAKSATLTAAAADAKTKADEAQRLATVAAAAETLLKANGAKADAIAAAAADAKTKADEAQRLATEAAAADATSKANKALADATTAAASVATEKANAAQAEAIRAAGLDASFKADEAEKRAKAVAATAQTAADKAIADALAAAGLAGTKGKTLIQSTAPGAEDRNKMTLWIDTTGGANTPKQWTTGTTWVAVTDKVAADAASVAAQAVADAATAAGAARSAQSTADSAMAAAGSKATILYGTGNPTGTAAVNTLWRKTDTAGDVIGEWRYTGGTTPWQAQLVRTEMISNLDVGKLTVGTAVLNDLVARKIAAATATFQKADIGNLTVTGDSLLNNVVAQKIAAGVGEFLSVTTDQLVAGSANINNLVAQKIAAGTAAFQKADISNLTAGSANMTQAVIDKLVANTAAFQKVTVENITATASANLNNVVAQRIAAGTASFQTVDAKNLFVTGTSSLSEVVAKRLAAETAAFINLSVDQLVVTGSANIKEAVADKLFANIFSTNKLMANQVLIGGGLNVIPDPGHMDAKMLAARNAASTMTVTLTNTNDYSLMPHATNNTFFRPLGVPQNANSYQDWIPVQPGQVWRFKMTLVSTRSTDTLMKFVGRSMDGADYVAPTTGPNGDTHSVNFPLGTSTKEIVAVIPSGCYWICPELTLPPGTAATWVDQLSMNMSQVMDSSLIVDGGILAKHITASEEMSAKVGQFLKLNVVDLVTSGSAKINEAVVTKLFTETFATRKLTANQIYIGEGGNLFGADMMDPGWDTSADLITQYPDGGRDGGPSMVIESSPNQVGTYFGLLVKDRAKAPRLIAGQKYRMSAFVRGAKAIPINGARIYMRLFKLNSTSTAGYVWASPSSATNPTVIAANAWERIEGFFTVPEGTDVVAVVGIYSMAGTESNLRFSDIIIQEAITPELIVKGAITTEKLTITAEMTAALLKAKKVEAIEIDVNSLKADTAWIGVLRTGILVTDVVTSTHIKSDSITADLLKADAITSKHTLTGPLIRSAVSGARTEMNNQGIRVLNASNVELLRLGYGIATGMSIRNPINGVMAPLSNMVFGAEYFTSTVPIDYVADTSRQVGAPDMAAYTPRYVQRTTSAQYEYTAVSESALLMWEAIVDIWNTTAKFPLADAEFVPFELGMNIYNVVGTGTPGELVEMGNFGRYVTGWTKTKVGSPGGSSAYDASVQGMGVVTGLTPGSKYKVPVFLQAPNFQWNISVGGPLNVRIRNIRLVVIPR